MISVAVRRWHSYIGLFVGPSVLFFALTGAAQIFNLHEAHGSYQPPAIVERLSSVHKDQVFAFGGHHVSPDAPKDSAKPAVVPQSAGADDSNHTSTATLLLKWFFLVVAVCLIFSTAFGLWMGLTQIRSKRLAWLLLLAGTFIPVALLQVA
jgi:hypothetical protein